MVRKLPVVTRLALGFIIVFSVLVPAASAQDVPDELLLWVDQSIAPVLERAAAGFERDRGTRVTLEVFETRDEIRDRFAEIAAAPDAPDIIALSDDWIYGMVERGDLAPIDLGEKAGNFLPLTLQGFMHGGHLYGVPYNVINLALVRNPELVPDPPQTWDEVFEISAALRESGRAEHGLVLHDYDSYHVLPILSAYGGYLFGMNEDGSWNSRDIGLNNDGAIMALEWLTAITQEGVLDTGLDWEVAHAAFEQGRAAMIISGPWIRWRFDESGIPYEVGPLPAGTLPARPYVHIEGLQMNAHSPDLEAAQAFLVDYVATFDIMVDLAGHVDGFSPHEQALSVLEDPHELGWAMAAVNGQLFPAALMTDMLWGGLTDAVQLARQGERDPVQALNEIVEQYLSELG